MRVCSSWWQVANMNGLHSDVSTLMHSVYIPVLFFLLILFSCEIWNYRKESDYLPNFKRSEGDLSLRRKASQPARRRSSGWQMDWTQQRERYTVNLRGRWRIGGFGIHLCLPLSSTSDILVYWFMWDWIDIKNRHNFLSFSPLFITSSLPLSF